MSACLQTTPSRPALSARHKPCAGARQALTELDVRSAISHQPGQALAALHQRQSRRSFAVQAQQVEGNEHKRTSTTISSSTMARCRRAAPRPQKVMGQHFTVQSWSFVGVGTRAPVVCATPPSRFYLGDPPIARRRLLHPRCDIGSTNEEKSNACVFKKAEIC